VCVTTFVIRDTKNIAHWKLFLLELYNCNRIKLVSKQFFKKIFMTVKKHFCAESAARYRIHW
jgi:hypothetical protein